MNATNGTAVEQGSFVANGRMWYTSLGHTIEIWQDSIFQAHIRGGIDWVLEGEGSSPSVLTNTTGAPVAGAAVTNPSNAASTSSACTSLGLTKLFALSLLACTLLGNSF